jgi:hypothetical protein
MPGATGISLLDLSFGAEAPFALRLILLCTMITTSKGLLLSAS